MIVESLHLQFRRARRAVNRSSWHRLTSLLECLP